MNRTPIAEQPAPCRYIDGAKCPSCAMEAVFSIEQDDLPIKCCDNCGAEWEDAETFAAREKAVRIVAQTPHSLPSCTPIVAAPTEQPVAPINDWNNCPLCNADPCRCGQPVAPLPTGSDKQPSKAGKD